MHRIGIATFAIGLALVAAPRAQAQSNNVSVCQDGTTVSNAGLRTCVGRGGVNAQATARAQQGRYGTSGTTTGRIQCPDGTTSTSGIHGCGTQNGGVYRDPRRTTTNGDVIYGQQRTDRRADGRYDDDDDKRDGKKWKKGKHKDNGKHLGQLKHADRDRRNDDRN